MDPSAKRGRYNKTELTKPLPRQPKAARREEEGGPVVLSRFAHAVKTGLPVRRVNNAWLSGLSRVLVRACEHAYATGFNLRAPARPYLHVA